MSGTQATRVAQIQVGDKLPEREFKPDNVQSMLYNAVLWNGHRIHFDEPYARDVEGYPGLVIAGPLLGDWLHQCLEEWLGDDGRITSIEYSNCIASYIGETLRSGGTVTRCDHPRRGHCQIPSGLKTNTKQVNDSWRTRA
jgi:3-methylfumaryl-CoA hydratase